MTDEFSEVLKQMETEQLAIFEVPSVIIKDGSVEEESDGDEEQRSRRCIYCSRLLDSSDNDTYSEVITWVRGKNKDSSTLRLYTGRLACSGCIHKFRAGISPTQEDIIGLVEASPEASPEVDKAFTDQSLEWKTGYTFGLADKPFPADLVLTNEHLSGLNAGADKREADRWK